MANFGINFPAIDTELLEPRLFSPAKRGEQLALAGNRYGVIVRGGATVALALLLTAENI